MADVACVDLFCGAGGLTHGLISEGVRVSLTTTNRRCKGSQFILHATALPGNPYDGHTLKDVIQETEALTGREIERVYVDKGYRGHDVPGQTGSSAPLRSVASTAKSRRNFDAEAPSRPLSATTRPIANSTATS